MARLLDFTSGSRFFYENTEGYYIKQLLQCNKKIAKYKILYPQIL